MDMECQKKVICEVYQDQGTLGELSARGRHSLDYMDTVEYFNLPAALANTIDEFQVIFSCRVITLKLNSGVICYKTLMCVISITLYWLTCQVTT